jgi:hypothetical protein
MAEERIECGVAADYDDEERLSISSDPPCDYSRRGFAKQGSKKQWEAFLLLDFLPGHAE